MLAQRLELGLVAKQVGLVHRDHREQARQLMRPLVRLQPGQVPRPTLIGNAVFEIGREAIALLPAEPGAGALGDELKQRL